MLSEWIEERLQQLRDKMAAAAAEQNQPSSHKQNHKEAVSAPVAMATTTPRSIVFAVVISCLSCFCFILPGAAADLLTESLLTGTNGVCTCILSMFDLCPGHSLRISM